MISGKAKAFLLTAAKVLIVAGAFYFIWKQLAQNEQLQWQDFVNILAQKASWQLALFMLSLSVANRFLEILKWQNLGSTLRSLSVAEATKQVLAALTASIFTPNGIGEYAGKALYFESSQTKRVLFLNLINNGIQMLLSVVFGIFGLLYFNTHFGIMGGKTLAGLFGIFLAAAAVLFFARHWRIRGYSIKTIIQKINGIPRRVHQKNMLLGLARYLVFSHQYFFLFRAFEVEIPYLLLMSAVAATYFIASSLPAFQMFDFAVKGSVAVYFFGLLGVNEWIVIFISTLMWLLNVVLPVLLGAVYVLQFKTRPV